MQRADTRQRCANRDSIQFAVTGQRSANRTPLLASGLACQTRPTYQTQLSCHG